ncbi:ABC transporter ATP-binding protein [Paenibacillus contaminans]|uniref:Multidrug ABC transporter permease/ATP-binding protein n=1 Tax=Paenibacillus contaminans TaxID=450362 RepID=A0A329MCB0_9BACL|nr:ABC transporter transmembrane domain-containing protein [Paenibacillus contaminans]RAV17328.1 multidrug ABC transporter permease/ATP-binding protein [Paenibacillus contaminans]
MFAVLYKLRWFYKMHWIRYSIAVTLLVIVGVLELVPPRMIGSAIDRIQQGTLTKSELTAFLLQFTAVMAVIYVVSYYWMYQLFGGAFLIERMLRSRFMRHLLRMTPTFFERNRTGDLMARATNDLRAISATAGFGILTLVDSSGFMLVILFAMGYLISWKLTLAALIPLPLIALVMSLYGKKIHERFRSSQESFGQLNDHVLEAAAGVRVIRAYVQETADQAKFAKLTDDVYERNTDVTRIDALFEPTVKLLVGASYLIGLGYGAYLVFRNEITLGELVTFNVYLGMMVWPMFAIGELINIMQRGNASLDRVNETLAYKPDVADSDEPKPPSGTKTLRFERVTFRYPSSETDNLTDISFRLEPGQTLGIVGRTGSGKTTLIRQLLRDYPSGKGIVSLAGVPIEQISLESLHGAIGYVPQEQMLFSKTVRENIRFGKPDATEEDIAKSLEAAYFLRDIPLLANGLDTLVGEKGVALSGGQKQRVAIARALIAEPEMLILDDSLSAVDAKTEAAIIANVRRLRTDKTTMIATHRLSAVQHADLIIVLEGGHIVEQGTHEQLLQAGGWYREQYERQQVEANLSEEEGGESK